VRDNKEGYKMNNLEKKLIDMGLKVWEKGNVKRIYVKSSTIKSIMDFDSEIKKDSYLEKNTKAIFSRIDSDGAWLNCETGKLESKKPTVQNWFQNSEFKNLFGY